MMIILMVGVMMMIMTHADVIAHDDIYIKDNTKLVKPIFVATDSSQSLTNARVQLPSGACEKVISDFEIDSVSL